MTEPRLLVVRLSALGDVIHTIPAVVALRQSLPPETKIGWVVEAALAELVRIVAPVDEVFVARTRKWRRGILGSENFREYSTLRRELRRFVRHDTSVDFQGLVKSSLFASASGARRRFGFARDAIREKPALLFTNHRVAVDTAAHVIDQNLQLARAVGAIAEEPPPVDYSSFAADPSGKLTALVTAEPVLLFPGAGQERKQWATAHFAEVARRLRARHLPVVVAWGPGEEMLAREIAGGSGAEVAPPTNLRELAFLIGSARLVLASDTGPLHLAVAMERKVVALFGPTSPFRNGPWRRIDHCVQTYTTTKSMADIDVDAVMAKIEQVMG